MWKYARNVITRHRLPLRPLISLFAKLLKFILVLSTSTLKWKVPAALASVKLFKSKSWPWKCSLACAFSLFSCVTVTQIFFPLHMSIRNDAIPSTLACIGCWYAVDFLCVWKCSWCSLGPGRLLGKCATSRRSRVLSLLCTCADNHPLVWLKMWEGIMFPVFVRMRTCLHTFRLHHDVHLCLRQPARSVCVRVSPLCVWQPVCTSCWTLSSWNTKQISSMW